VDIGSREENASNKEVACEARNADPAAPENRIVRDLRSFNASKTGTLIANGQGRI
jgi:hypothetical protein